MDIAEDTLSDKLIQQVQALLVAIILASCTTQIFTLSDDAGYQTGINDVVSSIIVI